VRRFKSTRAKDLETMPDEAEDLDMREPADRLIIDYIGTRIRVKDRNRVDLYLEH
jgi:hypothetical protein